MGFSLQVKKCIFLFFLPFLVKYQIKYDHRTSDADENICNIENCIPEWDTANVNEINYLTDCDSVDHITDAASCDKR